MQELIIYNIPNHYSSYYLLGFHKLFKVRYCPTPEFYKYNNDGFIIFSINNKLGVIDNRDPIGVDNELYQKSGLYFATNKLSNVMSYQMDKIRPLFPHYPVNIIKLYLKTFHFYLPLKLRLKDLVKELYIMMKRPSYKKNLYNKNQFSPYVFFSGNIWKKEPWANEVRAEFIRACKNHSKINFEGGFIPRSDGNNFGFDNEISKNKYSPKKFSNLSSKSIVLFNNPAVLGAVSWRLAEYWNSGCFVLSFPFVIDLPIDPIEDQHICFVRRTDEIKNRLDHLLNIPEYHSRIASGGKAYFDQYCTPEGQANYIVNLLNNER
jgi:hypothetical protein